MRVMADLIEMESERSRDSRLDLAVVCVHTFFSIVSIAMAQLAGWEHARVPFSVIGLCAVALATFFLMVHLDKMDMVRRLRASLEIQLAYRFDGLRPD